MVKKVTFLTVIIFLFIFNPVFSHVNHYKNLNKLVFDLYRNNDFIGQHIYIFKRNKNKLIVESTIKVEIKKLGITFYSYYTKGKEEYIDGKFESFISNPKQNEKKKFSKIYRKGKRFFIEGSSYQGEAPEDFIVGSWWNHSIIKSKAQISAVSGRIIKQTVNFLGKETLNINNKKYSALKFNFSSDDNKPAKDKKLNTDVWYDEKSLIWLKASFVKKGIWEYRLKSFQ